MASNAKGVRKNRDFRLISLFIPEMIQDRATKPHYKNPHAIYPDFKVTPLLDAEYPKNGIYEIEAVTVEY